MAKVPGFAKAFAGRWHIIEMDVWDNDFLDPVEEAHLTFKGSADGESNPCLTWEGTGRPDRAGPSNANATGEY
ncbi:hypothetical protein [Mesorhizobium sp. M0296]|uniref:hypothetical protein n=1 Tax=Mesorhizobium sp. M0296 TaxID=2956931 RepID=UPI003334EEF0